jgi:hypothetical protein
MINVISEISTNVLEAVDKAVVDVVSMTKEEPKVISAVKMPFRVLHKLGARIITGEDDKEELSLLTSSIEQLEVAIKPNRKQFEQEEESSTKSPNQYERDNNRNALDKSDLGIGITGIDNSSPVINDDDIICDDGDNLCDLKKRSKFKSNAKPLNQNGCEEGDYKCDFKANVQKTHKIL